MKNYKNLFGPWTHYYISGEEKKALSFVNPVSAIWPLTGHSTG